MNKRTLAIAAAVAVTLAAGTAIAAKASGSEFCDRGKSRHAVAAAIDPAVLSQWLPATEVVTRLSAQGYETVTKLEVRRGLYEAKATNSDGQRMELQVNPMTGDVIGFEKD